MKPLAFSQLFLLTSLFVVSIGTLSLHAHEDSDFEVTTSDYEDPQEAFYKQMHDAACDTTKLRNISAPKNWDFTIEIFPNLYIDAVLFAIGMTLDSDWVKYCLDHGYNPNKLHDTDGLLFTPLLAAQLKELSARDEFQRYHDQLAEKLKRCEGSQNAHFRKGSQESELITRYLIQAGADISIKLPYNKAVQDLLGIMPYKRELSALELAIFFGRPKNVAALLEADALDVPTEMPIVLFAIMYGNEAEPIKKVPVQYNTPSRRQYKHDIVRLLLAAGASPHEHYQQEGSSTVLTPLRAAATMGALDIIKTLVHYGATYDAQAVQCARDYGHHDVVAYLEKLNETEQGSGVTRALKTIGLVAAAGTGVSMVAYKYYSTLRRLAKMA